MYIYLYNKYINNPSTSLIESIYKESTISNTNIPALKIGY